ncbi:MAG: GNAT family N-acetyltransferase, partial [Oscillospiraceae bacterium]|nr:GNAT family N-acetyltransferase [Oscillospiraceae bacterium]
AFYERHGFEAVGEKAFGGDRHTAFYESRLPGPPFMIVTGRLSIRPFTEGDLEDLTLLIRDKMASEYAPYDTQWPTDDGSMGKVLEYYMGDEPYSWCAVELKETGRVVGFVCSGPQGGSTRGLGYTVRSDHQGRGYAYEACRALMAHCAERLGTDRFVCGTADCNGPSVSLLRKLGFRKVEAIEGSFAKDAEGNPIKFAAGRYERVV